jgi:tripartite-type tricarboxylate transporter receptor subunit TctC
MRGSLGQPIIIENVSGAGGTLGVGRVARSAGDGYTLSAGFLGTHVINGAIYALQYDVLNDFEPVSRFAGSSWLATRSSRSARRPRLMQRSTRGSILISFTILRRLRA